MRLLILGFVLLGVLVACPTPPPEPPLVSPPPVTVFHALTVTTPTQGAINSAGAGIACGSSCTASLAEGTAVTLTAVPAANFSFIEWSGACAGQGNPCSVLMNSAKTVGAVFAAFKGSFTPELEDSSLLLPEGVESPLTFKLNRVDGFDIAVSQFTVVATGKYVGSADVQVAVRVLPVQDDPNRLVLGFKAPKLGFNNPASFSASLTFKASELTKTIPVVLTVVPCTSGC
jgi:hypothetical protein